MNDTLKKVQGWIETFKSWEKRKQIMVLGGSIFVFVYMMNSLFISSAREEEKVATGQILELTGEINDLTGQTQGILTEVQNSVSNPNSQAALSYKQQMDDLDKKIAAYQDQLIPAKEMTAMLKKIFSQESGLKLVSLTSLPAVDILASTPLPPELQHSANRPVLYKRGAELVFMGEYFQTIDYLKQLENSGKHIFWDDFSYTVKTYPTAHVSLTVYTLTSEEGWVGG